MKQTTNKLTAQQVEFLIGLNELSRKTGIIIYGCGCCDSPAMVPLDEFNKEALSDFKDQQEVKPDSCCYRKGLPDKFDEALSGYCCDKGGGYIRWRNPAETDFDKDVDVTPKDYLPENGTQK